MPVKLQTAKETQAELRRLGSPAKAKKSQRFFKTGLGEYSEGDVFIGVSVPEARATAKLCRGLPMAEVKKLLRSKVHEDRMLALLVMVSRAWEPEVLAFYLSHLKYVNNWDLVDLSAPKILGAHLVEHPQNRTILYEFAKSPHLWTRRVAIVSTYALIKSGQIQDTFAIAEALMDDSEDLIHKAVGWMLREAGKQDKRALTQFLKTHLGALPRTTLRYAIERFPEAERKRFLLSRV